MKSSFSSHGAGRLSTLGTAIMAGCIALAALATPARADVNRIKGNPNALILDGVRISDDMEVFYLSGQLPSPVDAKKAMADVKSIDEMGDSKTQTISTLTKIKALLEAQGYKMSDLVKLSLFVAADPKTGKMDFAGVNEGFKQFFGTPDNPNTVARSTFQVAALVGPYYLIEIEAIAVKKKVAALSFKFPKIDAPAAGEADAEPVATPVKDAAPRFRPETRRKRASLVYYANGDRRRG